MSVSDVAYEPGLATRPRPGLLSVILPIRASGASDPRIGWLSHVRLDTEIPDGLSVLVVDDGSRRDAAGAIRAACERLGFDYARADEDGDLFSIGRCRNFGARFATSDYVFFQDVDLMPWPGFYARIIQEIGIRNLAGNASRFIMVPVSYLKQGPSADYLSRDPKGLLPAFLHHTLYRDQGVVEKVSTGTSACLYNRMFYLALGGNRSEFSGWGYEDLEFNCRIMRFSPVSRLPSNWCLDQGTFDQQKSFEGWKSLYRLHGDLSLAKGLLLFHRWHPVEAASPYMERAHHNRRIFNQCIRSVEDRGLYPRPLPDHGSGTSWVLRSNTFTLNRFIAPCWGRIVYSEKAAFESDADIRKFLRDANIERVVFHNPYATSDMQRIFACVRRTGIPYFVAERGALGDSFFYDPKGFLADSASYDPGHWNHELQPEQRAAVRHLMKQEQFGLSPLEAQDERLTRELLLRRLGLSGLKPVILVPLQRPGDTATRFFARGDVDYRRYLDEVKRLIALSSDRYDVVVKRHPLEDAGPALGGTDAGSANIFDLLSLCAAVVTFNSGVGCIAQCFMKPVLHFGRAFYSHDGTAMPVTSAEQALHQIDLGWQPCQRTVERFLHYLYFEFYSFGQFQTRQVMTDAGRITATLDILPRVLRLDQRTILAFSATDQQDVTRSMAMDRYPATEPAAAQGGDGAHGRSENLA